MEAQRKSYVWADDECFLCFVNAHGGTQDGEQVIWDGTDESDDNSFLWVLNDIVWPITQCAHLFGKPKLFFVNSCRGKSRLTADPGPGVHHHNALPDKRREGEEIHYVKEVSDHFLVFSTTDDAVNYRHRKKGTYFVNALVKAFEKEQRPANVHDIMTRVNREMRGVRIGLKGCQDTFGQCTACNHSLSKKLYL
eukprot:TRINITY_DN10047_c0_g1_i11.p1 TRINITY_DN10047_c0_g1~~TRINITY_DN10047_c0_g1_i11.p1  ORF type:complete len:227 (+),score=24.22 TRINITY_DN10047_c0_g1_i11:102-683(+)